jgi:hypothetical protein
MSTGLFAFSRCYGKVHHLAVPLPCIPHAISLYFGWLAQLYLTLHPAKYPGSIDITSNFGELSVALAAIKSELPAAWHHRSFLEFRKAAAIRPYCERQDTDKYVHPKA